MVHRAKKRVLTQRQSANLSFRQASLNLRCVVLVAVPCMQCCGTVTSPSIGTLSRSPCRPNPPGGHTYAKQRLVSGHCPNGSPHCPFDSVLEFQHQVFQKFGFYGKLRHFSNLHMVLGERKFLHAAGLFPYQSPAEIWHCYIAHALQAGSFWAAKGTQTGSHTGFVILPGKRTKLLTVCIRYPR
jgi:hypothetical protein